MAGAPGRSPGPAREDHVGPGLALALLSAASFATSGVLASGLLDAGWSPALAVTLRIALGALVLLPPALRALHGRWHLLAANARLVVLYGLLAVAVPQTCFFFAVDRLPVGPALLIEYTSPVAVLVWLWLAHGRRPSRLTVLGGLVAMGGLPLVLGLSTDAALDPVGVLWAVGAMVGAAGFFLLSGRADTGLPPLVLADGGLVVGAAALTVLGVAGVLPMTRGDADAAYAGTAVPAWVALVLLGVVSAALSYSTGIAAARRLGSQLASFVALGEVVLAFVYAWLLLGQAPTWSQAWGGALILGGVVLVKLGETPPAHGRYAAAAAASAA